MWKSSLHKKIQRIVIVYQNPLFNFHKRIGAIGESYALRYALSQGYILVEQNWKCSAGEIDLIFIDKNQYVFIEVKTRLHTAFARQYIFSNITADKKIKLRKLSSLYFTHKLKNKNYVKENTGNYIYRTDIIGVIIHRTRYTQKSIAHITL